MVSRKTMTTHISYHEHMSQQVNLFSQAGLENSLPRLWISANPDRQTAGQALPADSPTSSETAKVAISAAGRQALAKDAPSHASNGEPLLSDSMLAKQFGVPRVLGTATAIATWRQALGLLDH